mmetsp:Transcript_23557/g.39246  ORF Transcript_23557/g.39246 Transcript_23557/m.39246 type:complete len:217 (+) Transcript_23557:269-919(+)
MLAFNSLVVGSLRRNFRHAIGNSLYRPSAATTTIGHVCAPSPISCGFSTKSIKSSIPVINETIESSCESKLYLVDHPYELTGYQAPTSSSNSNSPIDVSKTGVFAVVDFSGSQYKISPDDVIVADKLEDVDVDSVVDLDKVLLVGSKTATLVGSPLISGAKVQAVVEEIAKDKKVIALKYRRRKNSKRIRGFRRQVTILRIKDIVLTEDQNNDLGL